jgi:hypothetical protein
MKRQLKSGFTWEYREGAKMLDIHVPARGVDDDRFTVSVPRSKVRSLECFITRVAWHRERRAK